MLLPWRVDQAINKLALAMGSSTRVKRVNGLAFRVRRLSVDEAFIANVVEQREYFPEGFTIRPTDTVIDIGGNIGTFAVLASTMATSGRVITVEPDADNLALLRTNLELNGCTATTVIPAAMSAESGTCTLFQADEGGGFHSLRGDRGAFARSVTVRGLTMAELFREQQIERCHFLKIDCEGAEYDFLPTMPDDVWARIDQIAMEYHLPRTGDAEGATAQLIQIIRDHGFAIRHLIRFDPPAMGGHLFATRALDGQS